MPFNRSEPSRVEIDEWFLDNPKVPKGRFKLGLALGGTVSAGSYTAGALDFLIEALDCWEAEREDKSVPQHGMGRGVGGSELTTLRRDSWQRGSVA